jgi:hypothetical protein
MQSPSTFLANTVLPAPINVIFGMFSPFAAGTAGCVILVENGIRFFAFYHIAFLGIAIGIMFPEIV